MHRHPTKMKTRYHHGQTEVLVLVHHPMDTGLLRNKKTHQIIPAHYIQTLTVAVNGTPALVFDMAIAISRNPLFGFMLTQAKPGDTVSVFWDDNKGEHGGAEAKVGA
ncbi:MAG: thiosulfate oxidation carrier complex protein SoxZ [Acidiferrobacteraceae bacterium]